MADAAVVDLLRRSQFVFEATVGALGRSTVADIPVDDHTVVVHVDKVLHSPAALARSSGSDVTVQLLPASPALVVGQRTVLFTTAVAFGAGIVVAEVGRAAPDGVGETAMAAGAMATLPGTRAGRAHPVLDAASELADADLRQHADEAAAVIVGRVVAVQKAGPVVAAEHDADWWKATIKVDRAERGGVRGRVAVLYPNSADVQWAHVPKPRAGQDGLWFLHTTPPERVDLAPYSLLDADDYQPADHADVLAGGNA
jgi:hypothetical protein